MGLLEKYEDIVADAKSPMPFGNESTWDLDYAQEAAMEILESPMPFGNESTWDDHARASHLRALCGHQCLSATSPLGTMLAALQSLTHPMGHQCLSATSPLGTKRPIDCRRARNAVTNAFRQRVHLGPRASYDIDFQWTRTTSERDMSCYCKS